jgi:putative ABC transport system permease protein
VNLFVTIGTALENLRTNKLRTALTMLGMIIGVSTVIIMVSIVEGARSTIVREFQRLGSDLIIIAYEPNRQEQRERSSVVEGLTMDDIRAIQAQCHLIRTLSAELPLGQKVLCTFQDRESEVNPIGVQPDFIHIRNFTVARGRSITEGDIETWSKVCAIGETARKELFPDQDPLGREIELRGVTLTIVGVLAPKGKSAGQDEDRAILLPISTVHKRFLGREIVGVVFAQPRDAGVLTQAMDEVWECLMRRHDNLPGFRVDSQENILNTIGRILTIFGLVMGSIAGLALLVGGIGIMNIMLVSVTERTREIGIRKALGAKRRDILYQFLIESATVSGLGGVAGIALGAGVAWVIGAVTPHVMKGGINGNPGLSVYIPPWAIIGAFVFSASVGLFFGIYPAVRAASLQPIEALRHE